MPGNPGAPQGAAAGYTQQPYGAYQAPGGIHFFCRFKIHWLYLNVK